MESVAQYMQALPADRKQTLAKVRSLIRKTLPGAKESMRYKMPTYDDESFVCAFASQKHYLSLYLCDSTVIQKHKAELKDLNLGKGCIRFQNLDAFPLALMETLLKELRR